MAKAKKPNESAPADQAAVDNVLYVKPNTEFPFVYANNVVMRVSELDGSLIFGEVVGEEEGKVAVVPKVKVVMAKPFLKELRNLLARNIKDE